MIGFIAVGQGTSGSPTSPNLQITGGGFTDNNDGTPADVNIIYFGDATGYRFYMATGDSTFDSDVPTASELYAGSGAAGALEYDDAAVGTDIPLTGFTSTSEAATRVAVCMIRSSDGALASNVVVITVSGLDFTAPAFSSAEVGNVDSSTLRMTFDSALYGTAVAGDFTLTGNTITAVSQPGGSTTIDLTLGTAATSSDDYTGDLSFSASSSTLVDADANALATFSSEDVTNNVTASAGNFAGITESSSGIWQSGTSGTDFTTSAFAIGTAQTDRVVYAAIGDFINRSWSNVTIGGVTASLVQDATISGFCTLVVYRAVVPTGTTAAVEVDGSYATSTWAHVWYGRECTEFNVNGDTAAGDPATASINPNAGSSIIAAGQTINSGTVASTTGVGVTLDDSLDVSGNDAAVVGHVDSVSTGSASYGFDYASSPFQSTLVVFEVRQA